MTNGSVGGNRNTSQQRRRSAQISNTYRVWHIGGEPVKPEGGLKSNKVGKVKEVKIEEQVSEADKLNDPDENNWKFKNKNGAIHYSSSMLRGCCGIGLVSGVSFGNIKKDMEEQFYKDVEEHLLSNGEGVPTDLARGSLMMTDAVGGEGHRRKDGVPSIYKMCTYLGWAKTSQYYNPRSGNYVVVFMKEKTDENNPYLGYRRPEDKPAVIEW